VCDMHFDHGVLTVGERTKGELTDEPSLIRGLASAIAMRKQGERPCRACRPCPEREIPSCVAWHLLVWTEDEMVAGSMDVLGSLQVLSYRSWRSQRVEAGRELTGWSRHPTRWWRAQSAA
jgi:hypothetical protein